MTGKIALIGCGIGDPELLTAKAQRKIREADVVVYDRLINPAILNLAQPTSEKIYVGKNPKFHPVPQDQIEEILIEKVRAGKTIVRLKSGDPYVFGRGGEEGSHLKDEGIDFEVIPGITSAIGGLAYGGIPITHRGFASSFHVYTGHLNSAEKEIDWQVAADTRGTLVFLMGMSELEFITKSLVAHGKAPETPAAIIQWASRKEQKTVVGTLENIFEKAQAAKLVPPSLIVIGGVVSLREKLNFFEERPLFGVSITMPYTEKKVILNRLTDLGAEMNELPQPLIEEKELALNFKNLRQLVLFDKQSVAAVTREIKRQKLDWRRLTDLKIITVGHHTKLRTEEIGILPDKVFASVQEFEKSVKDFQQDGTVLIGTTEVFQEIGADLPSAQFQVSHTEKLQGVADVWQTSDSLYFPSSKTAKIFLQSLAEDELAILKTKQIIVMGAITRDVFSQLAIPVIVTPEPSYQSVIDTIIQEAKR